MLLNITTKQNAQSLIGPSRSCFLRPLLPHPYYLQLESIYICVPLKISIMKISFSESPFPQKTQKIPTRGMFYLLELIIAIVNLLKFSF